MIIIDRNEQMNEAVNRMKRLKFSEKCIQEFLKGNILVSDSLGFMAKPNTELQNKINDFQLESGSIVYHVTHGLYVIYGSAVYEMFDFFIVSQDSDSILYERKVMDQDLIQAYVYNKTVPEYSEYGLIKVKKKNEILYRVG